MRVVTISECNKCPYFKVRWESDTDQVYRVKCTKLDKTMGLEKLKSPYAPPAKYKTIPPWCPLPEVKDG